MQGLPGIIIKDEQSKTDRNFAIAPTHKSDSVLQEDFQISSDNTQNSDCNNDRVFDQ